MAHIVSTTSIQGDTQNYRAGDIVLYDNDYFLVSRSFGQLGYTLVSLIKGLNNIRMSTIPLNQITLMQGQITLENA